MTMMITTMNSEGSKKIISGVDIGSNTIRLLVGSFENNQLNIIRKELSVTRLGMGLSVSSVLSDEAMIRSIDTLVRYSKIIKEHGSSRVSVKATHALREADNGDDFVREVLRETGLAVDIISGDEEAHLTALGVQSIISSDNSLIFDVGGGSTEFILSTVGTKEVACSITLGAVTLYESLIKSDPVSLDELMDLQNYIQKRMSGCEELTNIKSALKRDCADFDLIFTAGTATTLAAIKLGLSSYDPDRVNNTRMSYNDVKVMFDDLVSKSVSERKGIVGLSQGREDIIISGSAVALNVMRYFDKDEMIISDAGLLEGIVIDCYKNL
ncbi:hypothetical protein ACFL2A_01585 [Thermodesulfobacteriota bacterium]